MEQTPKWGCSAQGSAVERESGEEMDLGNAGRSENDSGFLSRLGGGTFGGIGSQVQF